MNQKFHPPGSKPIIVKGRIVQPGSFYEPSRAEVAGEGTRQPTDYEPPGYDDITVNEMKTQLDEWSVDYSDHDKDKSTLYAFFVEEAKRHANAGGSDQ